MDSNSDKNTFNISNEKIKLLANQSDQTKKKNEQTFLPDNSIIKIMINQNKL